MSLPVKDDHSKNYDRELIAVLISLKDFETKAVLPKIMTWIRRNVKNFVLWENHMFWCTAYGLRKIAPVKSRKLLL